MNNRPKFTKLFEPGRIGEMALKNRIVMAPLTTRFATFDGYVSEKIKDYYEEKAKGGAGLIILERTIVESPRGRTAPYDLRIDDEAFVPGLRELARVIQKHGARAVLHLDHAGRNAKSSFTHLQPVAPSPIPAPGREMPRELTTAEIAELVAVYARAAERAKRAGFDGVEFIAGSGLIGQFISPAWNKRSDAYGGNIEGRVRILLEIIDRTKKLAGQAYPIICRIYGEQSGVAGGMKLSDAQELARILQSAGVSAVHIFSNSPTVMGYPPAMWAHLAEGVKKAVQIPVITVGKITPELGEKILQDKKADFIAMGRALVSDPYLPEKVASGRMEDIIPCISCNECLDRVSGRDEPMICAVNASVGREREYELKKAQKRKRVLVVGGGPAGMEAARIAALRGHEVLLYEQGVELGGDLLLASIPPYKSEIQALIQYLGNEVRKSGVQLKVGEECTPDIVKGIKPDAVILATGTSPVIPEIPGLDMAKAVEAREVLLGKAETGSRVIIIGGGMVGCETAEFLAEKGKEVTILEVLDSIGSGVSAPRRQPLLNRLTAKGVIMMTGVKYERLGDGKAVITDKEGHKQTLEADTLVIAAGSRPKTELYEELSGKIAEVHLIGDCS
ncbi:MAG: FAD-dependent oxidoreductase, partial [Chloroflexi bacterium]|nr:FAD-dependent oxidoreductase [Chloroflexota bacterium]